MKFGVNLSSTGVLVLLTIYINYFIDIDSENTGVKGLPSFNSKRFRISTFGSTYLLQLVFCRIGIEIFHCLVDF